MSKASEECADSVRSLGKFCQLPAIKKPQPLSKTCPLPVIPSTVLSFLVVVLQGTAAPTGAGRYHLHIPSICRSQSDLESGRNNHANQVWKALCRCSF